MSLIALWPWFLVLAFLLGFEILFPLRTFLFVAPGPIAGAALMLLGLHATTALTVAFILGMTGIYAWRRHRQPTRDDRGIVSAEFAGRLGSVAIDIADGTGTVQVGDTIWPARAGTTIPSGTKILVTGLKDGYLEVVPTVA